MKIPIIIVSRILVLVSFPLFILSLFTDGFYIATDDPRAWAEGWGLLLFGWSQLLYGASGVSWLANPLLGMAWFTFIADKKLASFYFSLSSLSLMASFLLVETLVVDEGGNQAQITGYGPGYWLWLSSALAVLLANIFEIDSRKRQNNASQGSMSNTPM